MESALIAFGILEDVLSDVIATVFKANPISKKKHDKKPGASANVNIKKDSHGDGAADGNEKCTAASMDILSDVPDFVLSDIPSSSQKGGAQKPIDPQVPAMIRQASFLTNIFIKTP